MHVFVALVLATAAVSPRGAVATGHPLASEAGAAILRHGGNAVDAAVATAFALSVVEPQSSGIGGGGFALVYLAREKKVQVIDFREVAPAAATPQMYVQDGKAREDLARRIAATVQSGGGILTEPDLAGYKVREREPLEGTYRGHRLVTMPPPSSGGMILIGLLNVLEREDPTAGGYKPEPYLHVMIEAEKRLYAHREGWGDPDFNPGMAPIARQVISKEFARTLRQSIGDRATPAQQVVNAQAGAHTTHVSVVDAQGNAVALTTTVNEPFGSCVVAQGTGVLLNDEMDDFAVAPGVMNAFDVRGGSENGPGPGKVPLSSMAPTFVFTPGGELRLVLGAAGGSTIPTTVAQAIVQVLDYRMPIDRALAAPRIHHNLFPDVIRVEPQGMEASTARALEARGHRIEYRPRPWAKVSAVEVDPQTGWRIGAVDASFVLRGPGGTIGELTQTVDGVAAFSPREEVVVFLRKLGEEPGTAVYAVERLALGKFSVGGPPGGPARAVRDRSHVACVGCAAGEEDDLPVRELRDRVRRAARSAR